jgi:hypothetical protein
MPGSILCDHDQGKTRFPLLEQNNANGPKCVYWGGQATDSNTVNVGQPRAQFKVAIAGSNGYVTTKIATPAGYNTGLYYGKNAINAPYDAQGYNTFMGSKIFTGFWNVGQCAAYCKSQSDYNIATAPKDGTPAKVCKFFNTYLLTAKMANGDIKPQGQYCSLYTEAWPEKYATNGGQWRGKDQYTIDYSFGYAKTDAGIDPLVGDAIGAKYQAVADIKWSSLQPFCSTYLSQKIAVATITTTATITPVSTATAYSTSTVLPKRKRDDNTYPGLSRVPSDDGFVLIDANGTSWYIDEYSSLQKMKRDISVPIPAGLAKYQPAVISAACAMQVQSALSTSTLTQSTTVTGSTTTTTVSAVTTVTSSPTASPANDPADDLSEYGYFSMAPNSFNAAGAGYLDIFNNVGMPVAGMRDSSFWAPLRRRANIAIDPVSGHLTEVGTKRIAYAYTDNISNQAYLSVRLYGPSEVSYGFQPINCVPPKGKGSYSLRCSITSPNGVFASHFVGFVGGNPGQFFGGLLLSATPGADSLDGSLRSKATVTIFNR